MKNKWYIYFWHGADQKLWDKLAPHCEVEVHPNEDILSDRNVLVWNGTLHGFLEIYDDNFIVLPGKEWDTIAVSQYRTFGPR